MAHNSHTLWKTIRKLSIDSTTSNPPCRVSANQVTNQLLVNARSTMPSKPKRAVLPTTIEGMTQGYSLSPNKSAREEWQ